MQPRQTISALMDERQDVWMEHGGKVLRFEKTFEEYPNISSGSTIYCHTRARGGCFALSLFLWFIIFICTVLSVCTCGLSLPLALCLLPLACILPFFCL